MRSFKKMTPMVAVRALLTAWALLTVTSCQDGPLIRLTVDGRGPEINRLKFTGNISGQMVVKDFDKSTDLANITVSLPVGARGPLKITIEGYLSNEHNGVVSRGTGSVDIGDDAVYTRTISLARITPCDRGTCVLTVVNDPLDGGAVKIGPSELNCGRVCSAWLPEGTEVTLIATPAPGYTFQGWSGDVDCKPEPTCSFPVGKKLTVSAHYACTGWCNETPSSSTNTLYSVHGNGASSIVAVGDEGAILSWNGASWSAGRIDPKVTLRAVASRHSGGYLSVGKDGLILTSEPGKDWTSVNNMIAAQLNGILEIESNRVSVIGTNGTFFSGDSPTTLSSPCPGAFSTISLNAIASLPNARTQYVVGDGGLFFSIEYPTMGPPLCKALRSMTPQNLKGLWVGARNIYLVGEKGSIIKCGSDGTACTPIAVETTFTLHGIWGSAGESYLYTVGDHGVIVKSSTSGIEWELEQTGVQKNLYAVWGADPKTVYAVGQDGIILRLR